MDAIAWQLLLLELALVVVLAVLSASEAAINIARRPGVIDELTLRGRRGQRAGAIGRRAGYYLAAIQVAEFLIVFTYAGIAAAFIAPRLSALLAFFLRIDTTAIFTDVSAVAVTVAVLSLIAVLFGLFVPRAIAARHAQGTLLLLAFPLELITWLTRPIVTERSSSGSRSASIAWRANSGISSRNSTPLWASEISPGRGTAPPPTSATFEMV